MTGVAIAVAIGAFFYFDLGQFLSLNSMRENGVHLLAFTLFALLAMGPFSMRSSRTSPHDT